jgi:outer membrane protein assembly factor BamD
MKAQYLFAKNSFETKQEDRFNEAIQLYADFVNKYPSSKHLKEAEQLKKNSEVGIIDVQKVLAQEELKEKSKEDKKEDRQPEAKVLAVEGVKEKNKKK